MIPTDVQGEDKPWKTCLPSAGYTLISVCSDCFHCKDQTTKPESADWKGAAEIVHPVRDCLRDLIFIFSTQNPVLLYCLQFDSKMSTGFLCFSSLETCPSKIQKRGSWGCLT